jgi:hypothetical protein
MCWEANQGIAGHPKNFGGGAEHVERPASDCEIALHEDGL